MALVLDNVGKRVGAEWHLSNISMTLESGSLNVLLGPTLSGKTTLMRLMAGLDQPTQGRVLFDGEDMRGVPVQKRNVAMVYQQFINYPSLSVFDNIASPLRLAKVPRAEIDKRVNEVAALLKLEPLLKRRPVELSGGQQQRTALARALVKGADLVLLDEPLANLDYKLREELRAELPKIFRASGAIFVYATTEPSEALLLGGKTATLSEGRVTQFGPTLEVYRQPHDLATAQTFSDPPMNTLEVVKRGDRFRHGETISLPSVGRMAGLADNGYQLALRPSDLMLEPPSGAHTVRLEGKVAVAEITGSESFVHVDVGDERWVALVHGVHTPEVDSSLDLYVDPSRFFIFAPDGALISAPETRG